MTSQNFLRSHVLFTLKLFFEAEPNGKKFEKRYRFDPLLLSFQQRICYLKIKNIVTVVQRFQFSIVNSPTQSEVRQFERITARVGKH